MSQSRRFRQLQSRINELENLLPSTRPTGDYTRDEFDRVRAFQLLGHAEIEAFIEDVGMATVNSAFKKWSVDGKARRPLLSLLAYTEVKLGHPPQVLPFGRPELRQRLEKVKNSYSYLVKNSNGIREKDVLAVLMSAGLREADFDTTWLATIDSLGKRRGETAHTTFRVQSPPDPVTERDRVRDVIRGLEPLDEKLLRLSR